VFLQVDLNGHFTAFLVSHEMNSVHNKLSSSGSPFQSARHFVFASNAWRDRYEDKIRLGRAIWIDPERMSGTPCFRGTRVPVQSPIDLLEAGETIDQFLEFIQRLAAIRFWPCSISRIAGSWNARPY
jgi:uncharacterized protein (DUF433 family)